MNDLVSIVTRHSVHKRRRLGRSYDSVKIVDRILQQDLPINDRIGLLAFKISELRLAGKLDEAQSALQQYISLTPAQAEPWMILASLYRDDLRCLRRARLVSDISVAIAKLDGNFVRQALGEQMRTLLAAGDTSEANECLRAIMRTNVADDSVDTGFEDDFLNHPNARRLDPDLLQEYRKLSPINHN